MPLRTLQTTADGELLSKSENKWLVNAAQGSQFPYLAKATDYQYQLIQVKEATISVPKQPIPLWIIGGTPLVFCSAH